LAYQIQKPVQKPILDMKKPQIIDMHTGVQARIVAVMATYADRYDVVGDAIRSILPQVDRLIICDNSGGMYPILDKLDIKHARWGSVGVYTSDDDFKDMGKFIAKVNPDTIYLTVDDDLIYPDGYAAYMAMAAIKHKGIVTLHGKKLATDFAAKGVDKMFDLNIQCLEPWSEYAQVHVPGTGVMAWASNRIPNINLDDKRYTHQGFADWAVAEWAQENGVPITVLPHAADYLTYNPKMEGKTTLWTHDSPRKWFDIAKKINWQLFID
jgi:hypothetical protein